MELRAPDRLSPSKVEAFTSCPLAFRFSAIEKIPEPPSPHAAKGTLVHRALQLLFSEPPERRGPVTALAALEQALAEVRGTEEWRQLALDGPAEAAFVADAETLVRRYLAMEDPATVQAIGLELRLEAEVGDLKLVGIIDRLELDTDGQLVVTDYKTGAPPRAQHEQSRLTGVHFYAYLCEAALGRRPARVQLLYLRTGEVISTVPTAQSIAFLPKRTQAVHQAVVRACATGDFRPRPGPLCSFCAFQRWCPAFGGDPSRAASEAPVVFGLQAA